MIHVDIESKNRNTVHQQRLNHLSIALVSNALHVATHDTYFVIQQSNTLAQLLSSHLGVNMKRKTSTTAVVVR